MCNQHSSNSNLVTATTMKGIKYFSCFPIVLYLSLFVGSAAKRKQKGGSNVTSTANATAPTQNSTNSSTLASNNLSSSSVKRVDTNDLILQIEKVKNGTHEELLRRKSVIEKDADKRIAAADRFRKLQIKNINDLYEFEVTVLLSQKEVFFINFVIVLGLTIRLYLSISVRFKKPKGSFMRSFNHV